ITKAAAMILIGIIILTALNCIKESRADATALQAPAFALVETGQTVVLSCKTSSNIGRLSDGDCKSCLAWYYQRDGKTPKILIRGITTLQSDTPSRFVGSGSDYGTEFTLTISGVQTEDAGDYYCQSYHWINSRGVFHSDKELCKNPNHLSPQVWQMICGTSISISLD
ncbi:hypothetical protein SRHO_G00280610, partial [Serrasalmus rhombeus]